MENTYCPLWKGSKIIKLEKIEVKDINTLYLRFYHLDISHLFSQEHIYYCKCENCFLKFFDPSVIGDENFYKVLQKTSLYYMEDKEEYEFASKFIFPSDNVLDVGCGKGVFSKKINCNSFTGLELSTNAKEIAEMDGIKIINESIQDHCLYNKEKYDVVCTFQVLEHVDCKILYDFLMAMIVSIKKNGLLIISVPSDDSFVGKAANGTLNLPPHHQTRWPDKTLKEIAKIFKLEILDLHHDRISQRNKEEYLYENIFYMSTRKHTLISKKRNIIQKISLRLLKHLNTRFKLFFVDRIKPHGHSVTAVYKKISN